MHENRSSLLSGIFRNFSADLGAFFAGTRRRPIILGASRPDSSSLTNSPEQIFTEVMCKVQPDYVFSDQKVRAKCVSNAFNLAREPIQLINRF